MKRTLERAVASACLALAGMLAHGAESAATDPATIPAAEFFDFEEFDMPLMSPDGDALAVLVRNKAGRRQLAVIDTADLNKIKVVAGYADADIWGARWVDDKRLVYQLFDESVSADEQTGSGLFAIDRDGENPRTLIFRKGTASETGTMIKNRVLTARDYALLDTLSDGSADVIVGRRIYDEVGSKYVYLTSIEPLRLNTRTGLTRDAIDGPLPPSTRRWLFDDQGHVRLAISVAQGVDTVQVPDGPGRWRGIASFPTYGQSDKAYSPRQVGPDGTIYVARAFADGASTEALYRLEMETGQPEKTPIVNVKGFDAAATLVVDRRQHRVLGARYESDAQGTAWFDADFKAIQATVDERLPGRVNLLDPASCGCASRILVTSYSDRQPAQYFLYDRSAKDLIQIANSRPHIDGRQMAITDFFRVKTRDGQEMPVYVTKPRGKGPWPTVVLVHGGPYLRGWSWTWDGESQFLASRGFLVVKPEFRGSSGYGQRWELAGFRQWGLKMQDDIADATVWAAKEGLADPQRTCIAGASYGGYATLMGLVRYGDLYRCGVAWSAVTDLNLMYDIGWSDAPGSYKAYGMPVLIGDPVKDAEQLRATSPLQQAAHIQRPLLLAHGGVDARVPIKHATEMLGALNDHHAPVTWIEYRNEAHGWYKPETRADFYQQMAQFLSRNIGAAPAPAAPATP